MREWPKPTLRRKKKCSTQLKCINEPMNRVILNKDNESVINHFILVISMLERQSGQQTNSFRAMLKHALHLYWLGILLPRLIIIITWCTAENYYPVQYMDSCSVGLHGFVVSGRQEGFSDWVVQLITCCLSCFTALLCIFQAKKISCSYYLNWLSSYSASFS